MKVGRDYKLSYKKNDIFVLLLFLKEWCECSYFIAHQTFLIGIRKSPSTSAQPKADGTSQPAKVDFNKKSFPKQKTIQNFTIDAQGFRKTENENPPTWEIEITS